MGYIRVNTTEITSRYIFLCINVNGEMTMTEKTRWLNVLAVKMDAPLLQCTVDMNA